jgi:hypothetical protein
MSIVNRSENEAERQRNIVLARPVSAVAQSEQSDV